MLRTLRVVGARRALHTSSAAYVIRAVTVVGSGLMGSGIAQVSAASGCDVTLVDVDSTRVKAVRVTLRGDESGGLGAGR